MKKQIVRAMVDARFAMRLAESLANLLVAKNLTTEEAIDGITKIAMKSANEEINAELECSDIDPVFLPPLRGS